MDLRALTGFVSSTVRRADTASATLAVIEDGMRDGGVLELADCLALRRSGRVIAQYLDDAEHGVLPTNDAQRAAEDEEVAKLVHSAARGGMTSLPFWQILLLVFVALIAVGLPYVQVDMPPNVQAVMTDEEATVGVGLAIALDITQSHKK